MEIVAVYLEKPIKTYGMRAKEGLALLPVSCPADGLDGLCEALAESSTELGVELCAAPGGESGGAWRVCLPAERAPQLTELAARAGGEAGPGRAVSLLNLQGPHFGDRWGIASQALAALGKAGVEPCLVLGVTHTLQLVLPAEETGRALEEIKQLFSAPEGGRV
ncbi:MAG: hypothetical protein K9K66_17205 [Desulfarculaceae bacterium]|nr:hypothetical protein [Desulfarculaceae bacterium]MCF8071473.1 hypothetical protein [Desulfarculaceae bacterium]MCF8103399.1 hypothetical protein [Desulfarculaceae bacterium]MCF8118059.1 hypothetical protein [Desulfarculaceae bacterium]